MQSRKEVPALQGLSNERLKIAFVGILKHWQSVGRNEIRHQNCRSVRTKQRCHSTKMTASNCLQQLRSLSGSKSRDMSHRVDDLAEYACGDDNVCLMQQRRRYLIRQRIIETLDEFTQPTGFKVSTSAARKWCSKVERATDFDLANGFSSIVLQQCRVVRSGRDRFCIQIDELNLTASICNRREVDVFTVAGPIIVIEGRLSETFEHACSINCMIRRRCPLQTTASRVPGCTAEQARSSVVGLVFISRHEPLAVFVLVHSQTDWQRTRNSPSHWKGRRGSDGEGKPREVCQNSLPQTTKPSPLVPRDPPGEGNITKSCNLALLLIC